MNLVEQQARTTARATHAEAILAAHAAVAKNGLCWCGICQHICRQKAQQEERRFEQREQFTRTA